MSKSHDPIRVQFRSQKNQDPIRKLASGGTSTAHSAHTVYADRAGSRNHLVNIFPNWSTECGSEPHSNTRLSSVTTFVAR